MSRHAAEGYSSAICRDAQGLYIGASALKLEGISGPAVLEAITCREANTLATDLNLTRVEFASGCKEIVNDILNKSGGVHGTIIK